MSMTMQLWHTEDRKRWFLLPEERELARGSLEIRSLTGETSHADEQALSAYEVSEDQARRWAKDELAQTLDVLRGGIDEQLGEWRGRLEAFKKQPAGESTGSADAAPALLDFLKELPRVIGQSISGDQQRVDAARDAMTRLQQRLRDSGIDVDDRVKSFADRLASIRTDVQTKSSDDDDTPAPTARKPRDDRS